MEVKPDAIAQKLVESDLHKMYSLHFDDNDTDLEISRNRDKIRIQLSERELKRVRCSSLQKCIKRMEIWRQSWMLRNAF